MISQVSAIPQIRRDRSRWLAAAALAALCGFAASAIGAEDLRARLAAAGNASDDRARLAELRALAASSSSSSSASAPASSAGSAFTLDAPARAELTALLPVVEAWAEGRDRAAAEVARHEGETHRYLHNFFDKQAFAFDPVYPTPPREASPLYPLWAFYRGRMLVWSLLEHSGVSAVPERRAQFIREAERCFDIARAAFPQNPLLRIYGGENIPAADLSRWDDRAPAWANHERRALEQLHRVVRWWIAERQIANGEFGGKWGDDVEMWRWWASVFIGFDDPVASAAQERLARGNLGRPGLVNGYTHQLTDVEHTAEETGDTLTPMQHVANGNPEWDARTRKLVELAGKVWWGENARGRVQFKHIDFNDEQVGPDAGRAYDTGYHVRVLQPALLLWQRTDDPKLGAPLARWLRTWAEAALGTDNGKPAGIVPAALAWPSGLVGSKTRGWIGPDLAGDPMIDDYSWPSYPVRAMTATLLQAYVQTKDDVFLRPLLQMAELRRAHLAEGNRDGPPGSAAWAAHRLPRVIAEPLAKWRQLTGDPRFDDLLSTDAGAYVRYLLTRDETALTENLSAAAAALSVNWPMFTDEVRYTDRVLTYPGEWPRTMATGLRKIDHALVYSMVTGDPGSVDNFPLNGARWHTLPREIAVLVGENRRDRFCAELYHFGADSRALAVSLLALDPGEYRWTLTAKDGRALASGRLMLTSAARRLQFSLPPRTLCRLSLEKSS